MKKLLILGLTSLLAVSGQAQFAASKTLSLAAPLHTNVANGPFLLTSLQFYNSCVTPQTITLYDAPGTNNAITAANTSGAIGANWWSNRTALIFGTNYVVTTGRSRSVTNFSGVITTVTNTEQTLVSGFVTNAIGSNNTYRVIYTGTIPASSSLVPNLGSGLIVAFGINALASTPMSAVTNVTVNLGYQAMR